MMVQAAMRGGVTSRRGIDSAATWVMSISSASKASSAVLMSSMAVNLTSATPGGEPDQFGFGSRVKLCFCTHSATR